MPKVEVGNAEIVSLLDLNAAFPLNAVFANVPAESWSQYAARYPGSVADGIMMYTNFQAFAVRSPEGVVLVDMGGGPGPHDFLGGAEGQLGNELRTNGIDPADVTAVIFTHLHFDHVGWAMVGGRLFCPNARYLAPKADWDMLGKAEGFPPLEALQGLLDTGRLEFTEGEANVNANVTIVPTPGHTPGHQSVAVASVTDRAFIAGDLAPTQAVLQETDWVFGYDSNPATNIATRNRIFAQLEAQGEIAAFGHFVTPNCIGRIVRENGRRVFKPIVS